MKQTKLLVLSLLISQCVLSQIYEVGMYFGGSNFIGDVGSTSYIAPKEIALGGIFKWNRSPRHSFRLSIIKSKLSADKLLLSVGIKPNVDDLGLEALNIEMEKGFIKTNELMKTSENGIYAIGDVTNGPWLAHKASHEGILCVDAIKGLKTHKIKKENIPGCTYSRPQIASIGLTEKKALELNHEIKVGKFPFIGNGKAIALGEPEGFIKTIFDKKTGEFLGAHLVGPEVTELIQGFAIAKKLETTEEDLMETIFPHPTLSEAMHESVLDAYDRVIHF